MQEPEAGSSTATLLEGDVYTGLSRSENTAEIAELLTPVSPTNVLCVGLNYMRCGPEKCHNCHDPSLTLRVYLYRHYEEGAKKRVSPLTLTI